MKKLQNFVEKQAFGVCTRLGEMMRMSASSIRLYFIYASFLTFGSPILIYLVLAFWFNLRKHFRKSRNYYSWDR
jgi:phage shock protein PspC (stress-responsive transcriptional regulator)